MGKDQRVGASVYLDTFRFERSLTTPAGEILMSGIVKYLHMLQLMLSGRKFIRGCRVSCPATH